MVNNLIEPSFNNSPARVLNTGYQLSTIRPTLVNYSLTFTYTVTVLATLTGTSYAYLDISPDNTTWTTIAQIGEQLNLTLGVVKSFNFAGVVPAGWYARQRSVTSGILGGTAIITPNFQQEVIY